MTLVLLLKGLRQHSLMPTVWSDRAQKKGECYLSNSIDAQTAKVLRVCNDPIGRATAAPVERGPQHLSSLEATWQASKVASMRASEDVCSMTL